MIHPTAVIHPQARLDPTVRVGPYTVIDQGVEIGADCLIGPHCYFTGLTRIGQGNRFFSSCVIGEAPQDLKYRDEPTRLRIGDRNVFREHVTVHRSNKETEDTVIGSDNFFMQHSHVAHNVNFGSNAILAGGALLAGHVIVEDRAFISGNCLVHQFVRIGTLSMMQGGAAISKDLPPYTVAHGNNGMCGLNTVGLRRAGITSTERLELRQLYHALFLDGVRFKDALAAARQRFTSGPARTLLDFAAAAKRGILFHTSSAVE
ncbi:MAG TPA: acyl-ACP--UDP-N-acetylglucosamine O-acyltransferase [Clostridia bacterium]|nr:acyl-ACP--UDP-N-acetylglucosamine O-acyltransferase [Clostridia bacterium]